MVEAKNTNLTTRLTQSMVMPGQTGAKYEKQQDGEDPQQEVPPRMVFEVTIISDTITCGRVISLSSSSFNLQSLARKKTLHIDRLPLDPGQRDTCPPSPPEAPPLNLQCFTVGVPDMFGQEIADLSSVFKCTCTSLTSFSGLITYQHFSPYPIHFYLPLTCGVTQLLTDLETQATSLVNSKVHRSERITRKSAVTREHKQSCRKFPEDLILGLVKNHIILPHHWLSIPSVSALQHSQMHQYLWIEKERREVQNTTPVLHQLFIFQGNRTQNFNKLTVLIKDGANDTAYLQMQGTGSPPAWKSPRCLEAPITKMKTAAQLSTRSRVVSLRHDSCRFMSRQCFMRMRTDSSWPIPTAASQRQPQLADCGKSEFVVHRLRQKSSLWDYLICPCMQMGREKRNGGGAQTTDSVHVRCVNRFHLSSMIISSQSQR
ncbi:hypothetical protein INR49_002599 [Caranx melampygus]|nr:hypothetical protein INR49_002599 [Caranx melampygus]